MGYKGTRGVKVAVTRNGYAEISIVFNMIVALFFRAEHFPKIIK